MVARKEDLEDYFLAGVDLNEVFETEN